MVDNNSSGNKKNDKKTDKNIDIRKLNDEVLEKIYPVTKEQYHNFISIVESAIKKFKEIPKNKRIKLLSHLDADGITSAAIMINALINEKREYELEILTQLNEEKCIELAKENYEYLIFTDLGSGQIKTMNDILYDKKIIILDHHTLQEDISSEKITHVNPHLVDIDGSSEICGSGIVFFFTSLLNSKNYSMAHLALIGAIGDMQEKKGFTGLNNLILDIAIHEKKLSIKEELNFFGKQTRPLFKLLEYSSDLNIPGITGSQKKAVLFLDKIGIKQTKEDGTVKKFVDLSNDEKRILKDSIMVQRISQGLNNHENVLSITYELVDEAKGTFKDAKEFSTLLNACGRMNQAKIGVYACLNEFGSKRNALEVQKDYRKEIVHGMTWVSNEKKNPECIIKKEKYMIIKAQNNIMYTMIGTVASILTMSNKYPENFFVLSMAHNGLEQTAKISLRVVGNDENIDLQKMITKMIELLKDGEAGGHKHAAGAIIPIDKEAEFLKIAESELNRICGY